MRGSRKHMLDWIDCERFPEELASLAAPAISLGFTRTSPHMPIGHSDRREARLEHWKPVGLGTPELWMECRDWWLAVPRGANSPNWDFAAIAELDGQPGLVLIEAKANVPELSAGGVKTKASGSQGSQLNDARIRSALNEASADLARFAPGIALSADRAYQLSNRIAFAWKLASLGIPTALIYLGFVGDTQIADVGDPIGSDAHWLELVSTYAASVHARPLLNSRVTINAPMWLLVRSRPTMPSAEQVVI